MGEAPRLKAMKLGEILDVSFRLYRENFAAFLGILAAAYVPFAILEMALMGLLLPNVSTRTMDPKAAQDAMLALTLVTGASAFAFGLIAHPLATGALTFAVGARYLNQPVSLGRAYGAIFRVFFRYLLTILLSGLVIGIGMIFCLIPGLFFWVWFQFVSQIVVLEGLGGTRAMGRSRDLGRGFGWRILGYALLTALLSIAIAWVLSLGVSLGAPLITESFVTQQLLIQAVQQVINILIMPYFTMVLILLYYDLRVRKEAFDLEVLSKGLSAPGKFFAEASPPPAAPPA